ncbi:MAG: HTH-type transcriptional repressor NicS [Candidatus Marinimicrobia bacterium]|nr:HTH-type transcriptional repressor NicS [Candidatus Neomarinimicrobiota bacterium]
MTKPNHENQNNRQKIIDAATHLFASKGYNGVSVREIAEEASVTKPVIYYYFDNKKDLHDNILQEAFADMTALHDLIFENKTSVEEQLRELMRSHFRFCIENPDVVKILYDTIGRNISEKGFMPGKPSALAGETDFRKFSDFIRNGQAEGFIKPSVDPTKAGMMMLGAMNIFILTHLHSDREMISDAVADELMDMFLHGITNNEETIKENANS